MSTEQPYYRDKLTELLGELGELKTENFAVDDKDRTKGAIEAQRYIVRPQFTGNGNLVLLSNELVSAFAPLFEGGKEEKSKLNHVSTYRNLGTAEYVAFPKDALATMDERTAASCYSALSRFATQEAALEGSRINFVGTVRAEGRFSTIHEGDIIRPVIKTTISTDVRRGVDPIHDFAKELNRALEKKIFGQETHMSRDGRGSSYLYVDTSNTSSLAALPQQSKETIRNALANPREFVQEQRRSAGLGKRLQAGFDDKVNGWQERHEAEKAAKDEQPATARSGNA